MIFTLSLLAIASASTVTTKDCGLLTAAVLNKEVIACSGSQLTADCLAAFNTNGLSRDCISKLPPDTILNLREKTVKELLEGPSRNLPESLPLIKRLTTTNDWGKCPAASFVQWVGESPDLLGKILEDSSFTASHAARFVTAKTVPQLTTSTCGKLADRHLAVLSKEALQKISCDCLGAIPAEAFAGFDGKHFAWINASALACINNAQAEQLPEAGVRSMTISQARSWGVSPVPPPIAGNDEDGTQKEQRRKFLDNHPCKAANKWAAQLPNLTGMALRRRCRNIWNSASRMIQPSVFNSVALALLVAIVITVI